MDRARTSTRLDASAGGTPYLLVLWLLALRSAAGWLPVGAALPVAVAVALIAVRIPGNDAWL